MKKTTHPSSVVKTTRDAVIAAASRMDLFKKRTSDMAKEAEKKWESTRPKRDKAKNELRRAADLVVEFERDVKEGLRLGLAEVKKKNRKQNKKRP